MIVRGLSAHFGQPGEAQLIEIECEVQPNKEGAPLLILEFHAQDDPELTRMLLRLREHLDAKARQEVASWVE